MRCVTDCIEHLLGVEPGSLEPLWVQQGATRGTTLDQISTLAGLAGLSLAPAVGLGATPHEIAATAPEGRYLAVVSMRASDHEAHALTIDIGANAAKIWDTSNEQVGALPVIRVWRVREPDAFGLFHDTAHADLGRCRPAQTLRGRQRTK